MEKSEMKHAYLIMAHHEFEVLGKLVQAIDDKRNDIFIHFDAKLKSYPVLKAHNANLYILEKRIDIHWGHISQIKAEYPCLRRPSHRIDTLIIICFPEYICH